MPGTDDYHLCLMYGKAPGYEFIADTGCSHAMTYNDLSHALLNSWDQAHPSAGESADGTTFTPPEVHIRDDNSDSDEFMECIEAGGSGATCRR